MAESVGHLLRDRAFGRRLASEARRQAWSHFREDIYAKTITAVVEDVVDA